MVSVLILPGLHCVPLRHGLYEPGAKMTARKARATPILPPTALGLQVCAMTPSFYVGAWIQTRILMLGSYLLSYLSSPSLFLF